MIASTPQAFLPPLRYCLAVSLVGWISVVGCSTSKGSRAGGSGGVSGSPGHSGSSSTSRGGSAESGGAGTAAAAGATASDGPQRPCEDFCGVVQSNCTDEFAVYTSVDTCLAVCEELPLGSPGDEIGNSVACRMRNAELAASTGEPDQHCAAAGPGGAGVCGSNCEGYCMLLSGACSANFSRLYNGLAECQSACSESIVDLGDFDISQSSGDSLNCRLWHVSAATVAPSQHCGHASGEPPCA